MRCFVVAGCILTSASRGPSAIAEPLVVEAAAAAFLRYLSGHLMNDTRIIGQIVRVTCTRVCPVKFDSAVHLTEPDLTPINTKVSLI